MASPALRFGVAALATWRVTHLIAAEDGPADVVLRVRRRAGDSLLGELMDCFACTSVWVAAPFVPGAALSRSRADRIVALLALSGAACLLERTEPAPLSITNDEDTDELLWEGARSAEGSGGASDGGDSAGHESAGHECAGHESAAGGEPGHGSAGPSADARLELVQDAASARPDGDAGCSEPRRVAGRSAAAAGSDAVTPTAPEGEA